MGFSFVFPSGSKQHARPGEFNKQNKKSQMENISSLKRFHHTRCQQVSGRPASHSRAVRLNVLWKCSKILFSGLFSRNGGGQRQGRINTCNNQVTRNCFTCRFPWEVCLFAYWETQTAWFDVQKNWKRTARNHRGVLTGAPDHGTLCGSFPRAHGEDTIVVAKLQRAIKEAHWSWLEDACLEKLGHHIGDHIKTTTWNHHIGWAHCSVLIRAGRHSDMHEAAFGKDEMHLLIPINVVVPQKNVNAPHQSVHVHLLYLKHFVLNWQSSQSGLQNIKQQENNFNREGVCRSEGYASFASSPCRWCFCGCLGGKRATLQVACPFEHERRTGCAESQNVRNGRDLSTTEFNPLPSEY